MKTCRSSHGFSSQHLAFTLPEVMIAMAVFIMVIGGVLAANLYGLRMYQAVKPRLGVSEDARSMLTAISMEIRGTQGTIQVGTGDESGFTPVSGTNQARIGTALQISNATTWVRYYYDANTNAATWGTLQRIASGETESSTIVRHRIASGQIFSIEDVTGAPVRSNVGDPIIGIQLQFSQIEYPVTRIGPGEYFDYYYFRTRITPRTD